MGFFSGIGKAIKSVVGAVAEPISSIAGVATDLLGIGAPFLESQSVSSANAANRELMERKMQFDAAQAKLANEFSDASQRRSLNFTDASDRRAMDFTDALSRRAMEFTDASDRRAMDWSERMSNTAYQRATADLKAAGLNPMLAYTQGGAQTPGAASHAGQAGSGSSSSGASGSGVSSAAGLARMEPGFSAQSVASAAQAKMLSAQVNNINADTANKLLQADNIVADTGLKGSQSYERTTAGHVNQQTEEKLRKTTSAVLDQIKASTSVSNASAKQIESQNVLMKSMLENPVTRPFAPLLNIIFR